MSDDVSAREAAAEMAARCLALHSRRLARLITGRYEEALAPLGLTIARVLLLGAIARHGKVSPARLAEEMNFDPSTLSRNFKPLRAEGLIATALAPQGGHVEVSLTPEGEAAFLRANACWRQAQVAAEADLGPRLSEAVRAATRKLAD